MEKISVEEFGIILNELIRKRKINFDFYNSSLKLELLEVCYNKQKDNIDIKFRDIMKEHIDELRELNKSILKQRKD